MCTESEVQFPSTYSVLHRLYWLNESNLILPLVEASAVDTGGGKGSAFAIKIVILHDTLGLCPVKGSNSDIVPTAKQTARA